MKILSILSMLVIAYSVPTFAAQPPLSDEILCNTSQYFPDQEAKTDIERKKDFDFCMLKAAAKKAFNLEEKSSAPSKIQKISERAERLCNLRPTFNEVKTCYLQILNRELGE
jgi:hypothetical protein